MEFNFAEILKEAQAVANKVENNSGASYKHKLVYPQTGTIQVKLLFNTQSNTVKRLVNRHTIDDVKIPCMRTWGQDCPICKMIDQISKATGYDMYKVKSMSRGISMVEYVDSSYKIEGVAQGDVILLMYPWTVYKDLSSIIAQANTAEGLKKIMASNEGFTININRGTDNKYSAMINPFATRKSRGSDAEFEEMLKGIENLNDLVLPESPTDEIKAQVNEAAQALQAKYLGGQQQTPVYNQQPQSQPAVNLGNFTQPQPVQPSQQPQPNMNMMPQQNGANPPCMGKHGVEDANKCLMCPLELQCMKSSSNEVTA